MSTQADRIKQHVTEEYGAEPEFLWPERYPDFLFIAIVIIANGSHQLDGLLGHLLTNKQITSIVAGLCVADILKSKMTGATLKGDGFNMSGSTARTDDGIKNLDNWLSGLGFN